MTDLSARAAALAVQLQRHGAQFVVVGSTARWLVTRQGTPRDLDVAVCRDDLPALADALDRLGVRTTAGRLGRGGQSHVDTSWGPLDVFVDDGVRARTVTHEGSGRHWRLRVVSA